MNELIDLRFNKFNKIKKKLKDVDLDNINKNIFKILSKLHLLVNFVIIFLIFSK